MKINSSSTAVKAHKDIFVLADNIITPLGFTTKENIENILKGNTELKLYSQEEYSPDPFCASLLDNYKIDHYFDELGVKERYTRLEKIFILSIKNALKETKVDIKSKKTLLIISTTKGNIDLLESKERDKYDSQRLRLGKMATIIQDFFHNPNCPIVVSHACISGVLSIITAFRLLQNSQYENIIVSGGDIISAFTVSGFQSFKALSLSPCKPFDVTRDGLNLGEGCGTIILTSKPEIITQDEKLALNGGAVSNDANHISGPSRSGDGLFMAINETVREANLKSSKEIDYISAHGTATLYNDEMESKAFHLAGINHVPVNSYKGFFGHTLGAAGIIESIIGLNSIRDNVLYSTLGYNENGVTQPINVIKNSKSENLKNFLKTASGFGGCNGAILFSKV